MAYELNQVAAPKPTTATSAIEDFDQTLNRLESLIEGAANSADKLVGSRPTPISKAEAIPTPQSLISQIQMRRDRLVRAVDHLESELRRIDNGIS